MTSGPSSKVEGCVQVVLNYLVSLLFSKRKRDKIKFRRFVSPTWIYTHSQHKLYLFPTVNSLNVQRLKILLSPATVISQFRRAQCCPDTESFLNLSANNHAQNQKMNVCDPKLVSKSWQARGQLQMENRALATHEGFYASARAAERTGILSPGMKE